MTQVTAWVRGERRAWLLRDFYSYAKHTGMCPDLNEDEYGEICQFLEECLPSTPRIAKWRRETGRDKRPRLGTGRTDPLPEGRYCEQHNEFEAPRKTYKTSLIKALVCYAQEIDPDIRIVLGRATQRMAEQTLGAAKDEIERNKVLTETFGDLRGRYTLWAASKIVRGDRSPGVKEPTVDTTSLGSSLTGQHPDFVILDDLVHEGNYESDEQMQAAKLLVDAVDPVLESWGSLLLLGTRWGNQDVMGHVIEADRVLVEAGKNAKFRHLILEAYDAAGAIRFPTALPEAFLARRRDTMDPKLFAAWYLNRARADGEDIFTLAYIQYFDGVFTPGPFSSLRIEDGEDNCNASLIRRFGRSFAVLPVMLIDPAPTVGPTSDFTGHVVVAFDHAGNYWVLYGDEYKKLPTERLEHILDYARAYDPDTIALENADLTGPLLQERLLGMGLRARVVAFDPRLDRRKITASEFAPRGRTKKAAQIEALEPILRARRVFFARGTTGPLVRQLQAYPYVAHDDVLDAFSMAQAYEKISTTRAQADPDRIFVDIERREFALEGLAFDGPTGDEPVRKPGAWAGR
jgi:hypothetical protein